MADYSKFQGYVDPKEEIFYEPHESRVDGDKYQAVVPEFNTTNKTTQFFKEDANKQCVLMPMDVSYLHTSCVYDPAILSELDEKEVDEFINYVHKAFGGDTNYYTHHNALEEMALNLIYRFQGDLKRARLYCDSCMSACGEMLMWKVEDSKGTGAKSSIHYHLVPFVELTHMQDIPHSETDGMDNLSRVWCHWRDDFNKLVANHATFKEYENCLVEAEKLIESYGNPNTRFFSSVNRLKSVLNSVNSWRGKLHDTLNRGKYIPNEDLQKMLNEYPHSCPSCEEVTMLEHLIHAKEALEEDVDKAIDSMSSVSYLLQIQKRVHQFEIPVKRSDDLDKKVDLAIKMQERVDIIANRSFSSDYPSSAEMEQIKRHMIQYRVLLNHSGLLESIISVSEKTSNLLTESVDGKTLEELESILQQLKSSPIPQPQQEQSIANRVEKIKWFKNKQKQILDNLHPINNRITVEELLYSPESIPDFSFFDASTRTRYRFPSTQYKTLSIFISKIKELHFAESDFEPIMEKEKQYSSLLNHIDELITSVTIEKEDLFNCLQSVLDAEILVSNFHLLVCRAAAFMWNEQMNAELDQETMNIKQLSLLLRDLAKIQLYINSLTINLRLEFVNAEKARFIVDHYQEWNMSVRRVLSGKQRTYEHAKELLQRGQDLNMTRSPIYLNLKEHVDKCESWSERAQALSVSERVLYSQYSTLVEEKEHLLLTPSFDLPLRRISAPQNKWQKRVKYLAKTYYRLYKFAIVDRRIKRKSDSDIDMLLEEEKSFEVYFDQELLLLKEMKHDHESIKRECRYLLTKYSKALQQLVAKHPMPTVDYAIENKQTLNCFWIEKERLDDLILDDWFIDLKSDIADSQPFMIPKEVTDQDRPSLFVEPSPNSNYLTQLEASVNCAIHTQEEVIRTIQQRRSCVNERIESICRLNCQFLPDLLCMLNAMKYQYFFTKEEEELELLIHVIRALFTVYSLFYGHPFPDLFTIPTKSLYPKRKRTPLSDVWIMFQEEEKTEYDETARDLLSAFQDEETISLTYHHYSRILQFLYLFREHHVGRQFYFIFNFLFIPIFEEFYTSTYIIGMYFREQPCFTMEDIIVLLNLIRQLRCQCDNVIPLYNNYATHNHWEQYLQLLHSKQEKLDGIKIAALEKEIASYELPEDAILTELSSILKESRKLISSIKRIVKRGVINSFDGQRAYHLALKKATYVDLTPFQEQLEDTNTQFMCLCTYDHMNDTIVMCKDCDQYFHASCCNFNPVEQEAFSCPLCLCDQRMAAVCKELGQIVEEFEEVSSSPSFQLNVYESNEDITTPINENKRQRGAKDEDYTNWDDKVNVQADHPDKRRKSERISERILLEEEHDSKEEYSNPYKRKHEENSGRSKSGRIPNSLSDLEMNSFLKVFLSTPHLYHTEKWIIDCASNRSNISSLKLLNPYHVNNIVEWMDYLKSILTEIDTLTDIYEMTRQQTLPGHFQFLFFEYIRLHLDREANTTRVLTLLASYVWYKYTRYVLLPPKDIHAWKRCVEMATHFNLAPEPLLAYVELMTNRIEKWNKGTAYVINPHNHQDTTLRYMQELLDEADSIPAILHHRTKLETIAKDGAKLRCYCRGYNDGSEMIHCRICNDLFHLKCLGVPKGGSVNWYFKCEFCTGRRSRDDLTRAALREQRNEQVMVIPEQRALAILDRTSIHPNHYCRIVVSVNINGTIKARTI